MSNDIPMQLVITASATVTTADGTPVDNTPEESE